MTDLATGEVPITLNDKTLILKPTLRAITMLSNQYGGLAKLREQIVAQDFQACVATIRWGLNLNDREASKLPEQVYANGVNGELMIALIRYAAILGNGGKPIEGDAGAGTDEVDAGNG